MNLKSLPRAHDVAKINVIYRGTNCQPVSIIIFIHHNMVTITINKHKEEINKRYAMSVMFASCSVLF